MGYTNYWRLNDKKKEFSSVIIGKVKKIYATYREVYGQKLCAGFFDRTQDPIANKTHIQFNAPTDDTGEDFGIDQKFDWDCFCKTCRENYDAAVKAVLMVLASAGYITKWHFDGDVEDEEFKEAVTLLEKAGIKYTDKMKPRK